MLMKDSYNTSKINLNHISLSTKVKLSESISFANSQAVKKSVLGNVLLVDAVPLFHAVLNLYETNPSPIIL